MHAQSNPSRFPFRDETGNPFCEFGVLFLVFGETRVAGDCHDALFKGEVSVGIRDELIQNSSEHRVCLSRAHRFV